MATNSDEDKAAQEAKKRKFKEELASAKKHSPEEVRKIINDILKSSLPPEMMTSLLSSASSALAEAIKTAGQPSRDSLNSGAAVELKTVEVEKARYESGPKKVFDNFDGFHENYLKKQTTYTSVLEEIIRETAAGKNISPDLENKLKQAEEDLKKDKARIAEIRLTGKIAAEEQEYHLNKLIEVDKAKAGITPTKLTPQQLDTAGEFHVKCLGEANTKLAEVAKHYEEEAKQAAIIKNTLELSKNANLDPKQALLWKKSQAFHNEIYADLHDKQSEIKTALGDSKQNAKALEEIRAKMSPHLAKNNTIENTKQNIIPIAPSIKKGTRGI
jgi:hypothetical protein